MVRLIRNDSADCENKTINARASSVAAQDVHISNFTHEPLIRASRPPADFIATSYAPNSPSQQQPAVLESIPQLPQPSAPYESDDHLRVCSKPHHLQSQRLEEFYMSDVFSMLPIEQIDELLSSDSLYTPSELMVYKAAMRWLNSNKDIPQKDLNFMISKIKYLPRYCLMTLDEFRVREVDGLPGPKYAGMLSKAECKVIEAYIKMRSRGKPTRLVDPEVMARTRTGSGTPAHYRNPKRQETRMEKGLIYFLLCWTSVFD